MSSKKTALIDSSISTLNLGIELYASKSYEEAELIFGKLLENDLDNYLVNLYLAFTRHRQNCDFSILIFELEKILNSSENIPHTDSIYQEIINYIDSWLEPEIIKNEENKNSIEWDNLIDGIHYSTLNESQKLMSDLIVFSRLIMSFSAPYPELFIKVLIKRYQYPWAYSWWSRDKILNEFELLVTIKPILEQNMEETKLLFSTLSNLHIDVLKLYIKTKDLENYSLEKEQIKNWNTTIENLFDSIDFSDYELGFNHQEKIAPFLDEIEKHI